MKAKIFLLVFIILSARSYAQKFSIAAERMNVLYMSIDNPIKIAVENIPCAAVVVRTDNGKISGSNGSYALSPASVGTAGVFLYRNIQGHLKKIGESRFRVRSMPGPSAKVGPSSGGRINKIVLRNQQYIRADYDNIDIDYRIAVDSFSVYILRKDTNRFDEIKNTGNKFNDSLFAALQTINTDDIVIFKDICTRRFNREIIILDPIIFTIY